MSWADAQPAMATKAVDGQENPLGIFAAAKLHTVSQTHLTLWGYVADPLIYSVNKQVWDAFSPEDQKILRDAAVEAGAYNKELARKGITQADPSTLKEIEGLGVTISRLSDAEIKAFRDTTRPVYDKWKARIGNDLVAGAEKAVSARSS
jgi:TRAP-type transport system periplasmic protein